tara:strand:+ start:39512 stop:44077 length:4566 start_codon:yes stop_codon:yes gene_type:complete
MLESGDTPVNSVELARDQYEKLKATGHSTEVEQLEFADAEQLRGEALAAEMAEYDPSSANADEVLGTMQYLYNADIRGDAFSFALPRVFAGLVYDDNFYRLDGLSDQAVDERGEFVTRLNASEFDYKEQAEISILKRARDRAKSGSPLSDVFASIREEAEESDDVLDAGFVRDVLYMTVPFIGQANLEKSFEEWTGRDVPLSEAAFMGEVLNKMKQEIVDTPPALREERVRELVKVLKNNSGANGVITKYAPESLRGFVEEIAQSDAEAYLNILSISDTDFLTDDSDWGRWVDNAFTVIDAATLGYGSKVRQASRGIGARFFRLGKGERATAVRAMSVTDDAPKAKEILSLSLADETKRMNPAIGMSEEDHVGALLPNVKGDGYDLLPDYTQDVLKRNEELQGEILGRRTRRNFFNNEEEQLVRDSVDKFNLNTGGSLQPTRSQIGEINENGDSFNYVAQFGASEDRGFKSVADAEEFVTQYLGKDAKVEYLKHDPATGQYHALDEGPTSGVEYVARYDAELFFPREAAGEFDPMMGAYRGLVKNGWLANPSTKLDSQIRFAVTRTIDDASFVQQKLTDIHRPFTKLKRRDQQVVIDVENAGAKAVKDFSPRELMEMRFDGKPLTDKQMAGYYSRLQTRRALWEVENRALYEKMKSHNMKQVEAEGFRHAGSVVPVESIKSSVWAYSPVGKKVTSYSPKELDALYHNGGSIVELWRPLTIDGNQVSRVIVDGSAVSLSELPRNVLRYVPGYQPRYYNARWFVRKKQAMRVDGVEQETSIPIAGSAEYRDAQALVAKQPNPDDYFIDMDRVATNGLADSESLNWELDNLMFYNSRSDQEIAALGDHNIIVDPVEALRRSVNTVSNTLGQGRLREVLVEKYKNTYADVLPKDRRGLPVYPERKSDIKAPPPGDSEAFQKYRDARAMHDYIRIMSHGLDPMQKTYRNIMMNTAAAMEKKGTWGSQAIARAVYGATEEFSPTAVARTAAFTTQILAAPLRQAWIQSHQALFLTGIDPGLTVRSFLADGFWLDSAFVLERAGAHNKGWAKAIANATKEVIGAPMNTAEMENLYKNFAASGMPYLRSALVVEGVDQRVLHTIGEFGYALGERHNLAATYAFAYRKYLKDTGKTWKGLTDKDWETIAFKSREYSLNMTRADAFNYQHGLLSAATQYLAIRQKAVNTVLTSKEFTTNERLRIMAGQVLLFGAEGAGIGLIVNSVMENMGITYDSVPELGLSAAQVKQAVEGGVYDLMMNRTLQSLMDQQAESDAQFARNMAALGEADRFVATLFSGMDSIDLMEFAAGPSASVLSNSQRATKEVWYLTHSDLSTPDKVAIAAESVFSVFSQGSNLLKTKVGANMKLAVDSRGRPISEVTDVDMLARRFFGFGTAQENEYYENLNTLYGDASSNQETLDEAAEILAGLIRRQTLQGNWDKAKQISGAVFELWTDPWERAALQESLASKLSDPSVANVELYKQLVKDWGLMTEKELQTKLLNESFFLRRPEDRARLKSFIEEAEDFGTTNE